MDWPELLDGWTWLLPEDATVWLMNRFGDLFLTTPDGSVHMLDVGSGSLRRLADDRDDLLRKLDDEDNAADWLLIPLVDRLVASSIALEAGHCYSLVLPPILGGEYKVDNIATPPIQEHYGLYASYQ